MKCISSFLVALVLYGTLQAQSFWKPFGNPVDTLAVNSAILYDAAETSFLAATLNKGIYRSKDGGNSYQPVLSLAKDQPVFSLYQLRNGTILAGGMGVIYRSIDHGEKWEQIRIPFPDVYKITEDRNGNVLICASQDVVGGEGILRSEDGGLTWQPFNNGLPNGYIGNLVTDTKGNVFCGMMNDTEDGLYWYNESQGEWQALSIQLQLGAVQYKLRSVNILAMGVQHDSLFISVNAAASNFGVSGLIVQSIDGVLQQTVWQQVMAREGIPFTTVLRNLLLTPQGSIHGSIPTTGPVIIYNKMAYQDSWINCKDGIAPKTYGLAFFYAMPDGSVIMGNPSGRFYITREGVPGRIPQTIQFEPIGAMHLYDSVTIYATASSGAAIVYTVEPAGGSMVKANRLWAGNTGVITAKAAAPATGTYYYAEVKQTVQVRKARNHIHLDPLPVLMDTSTAVPLKASASSGEKVLMEVVSGPALINDDKLTVTGAGKLVLRFTEPGNNSYLPADTTTEVVCIFPRKPVISIESGSNGVLLRSSSPAGNQWYADGNPVLHQNADTLKPSGNGNFAVKVTISDCASELSSPVVVTPVNEIPGAHPIRIYPGLFSNELRIDRIPASFSQWMVSMYDVTGRLVLQKNYSSVSQVQLDTKHFPAGTYVVVIRSGKSQVQQKLIKLQ